MPKQVNELPPASSVADTDLTNIKQGLNDRYASISQINDNVGTAIDRAADKATPIDADTLALSDSAASNVLKKLSWANVKATLKTYFESVIFTWALRQVFTIGLKLSAASEAIRFGSGNNATNADFDMDEVTTANSIFRFFRNTNTSGARQLIVYKGNGSATVALFFDAANDLLQVAGNTVWHAGNDGPGSGLNADLVDGAHPGTGIGDLVELENVGGSPGLPAVDGSQLLNLPVGDTDDKTVKASATDTTPGTLLNKFEEGDGVDLSLQNGGANEKIRVSINLSRVPRTHFVVRAGAGATVSFGDTITDDVDSPYQGPVKNHLIYRNGQLLVNTLFNDHISPDTGDYSVTDEVTGEITLTDAAVDGEIFTYVDIRMADPTPAA